MQHKEKQKRNKQKQFQTKATIGAGSFGQVQKCKNIKDGKTYAVKIISGISQLDIEGIQKQGQAMMNSLSDFTMQLVDHFYDQQYQNGSYIFVMPFYKKGSLTDLIKRQWKTDQILLFLYQMSQAFLSFAIDKNCWHLDLKPDNILIKNEGQYIICDFGCAKLVQNICNSQCLRISINKGGGTTDYAAPQLIQRYEGTKYSDMWSLGVILYQILYKQHPLRKNKGNVATMVLQFKDNFRKIQYKPKQGYDKIVKICQRMLKPKRRLQWCQLKQTIYQTIQVPHRIPIIVSIDKFIQYISSISTIVFGLIFYLNKNQKNIQLINVKKQADRLIDSAKLYNYILCSKAQEAIEAPQFKPYHSFYLFCQTKTNKTIHHIQKLQHLVNTVKNFSTSVLQCSNLDDYLTAKNGLLDNIDDYNTAVNEQQFQKFHQRFEWQKISQINQFIKGKTNKIWNMDYVHKGILKKFAYTIINQ